MSIIKLEFCISKQGLAILLVYGSTLQKSPRLGSLLCATFLSLVLCHMVSSKSPNFCHKFLFYSCNSLLPCKFSFCCEQSIPIINGLTSNMQIQPSPIGRQQQLLPLDGKTAVSAGYLMNLWWLCPMLVRHQVLHIWLGNVQLCLLPQVLVVGDVTHWLMSTFSLASTVSRRTRTWLLA